MEVRYPPLKNGGSSAILARYPMKTRQMGAIPPSAILSRKGIARYGGVSRTGPLRSRIPLTTQTSLIKGLEVDPLNYHRALQGAAQRGAQFVKVARLQSEFCTKDFFRAANFLTKNAPKFSPKCLSLCSVGQKKSPENSFQISH